MRRGELAALRWADVDLDAGSVTVRRNRVTIGYDVSEGTPKTKHGQRFIDLAAATVAVLKAHRRRQAEARLAWSEGWADQHGLVFTREDGSPPQPQAIATLGLAAGVPLKVMSERLGHSSRTVTADLYQHVVPGMQADAVTRIMEGLG